MKHFTLLILLLFPVLFYGQEETVFEGFIVGNEKEYFLIEKSHRAKTIDVEFSQSLRFKPNVNLMWVRVRLEKQEGTDKLLIKSILGTDETYTYYDYKQELKEEEFFSEPVEAEGFYSNGYGRSAFFEIISGHVAPPVWLNLRHDSLTVQPDFVNTSLIKVTGICNRGKKTGNRYESYNEEIVVNSITLSNNFITLENYLKEQAFQPKTESPYEAEGYLEFRSNHILFFPVKENIIEPGCYVELLNRLMPQQQKLWDSLSTPEEFQSNKAWVRIKGFYRPATKGDMYDKLSVNDLSFIEKNKSVSEFCSSQRNKQLDYVEYFEGEGYYTRLRSTSKWDLRGAIFEEVLNDTILPQMGRLDFDASLHNSDILTTLLQDDLYRSYKQGTFIKLKGIRQYGEGVSSDYKLYVTGAEVVSGKPSKWEYAVNKINQNGHLYYNSQEITFFPELTINKKYTFTGSRQIGQDSLCKIKVTLMNKGEYMDYDYTITINKKKAARIKGKTAIDLESLLYYDLYSGKIQPKYTYKSIDDKLVEGESLMSIFLYSKDGNPELWIEDLYSGIDLLKDFEEPVYLQLKN